MGADRIPMELLNAQSAIEESQELVEDLKHIGQRTPGRALDLAKKLLTDFDAVHAKIRASYGRGFDDEARQCESYLYKRQADVAIALLFSLPFGMEEGRCWSGRAEEWLKESFRLYPTMQVRFHLANLYASLERYAEALTEAQAVAQSDDPRIRAAAQQFIQEVRQEM